MPLVAAKPKLKLDIEKLLKDAAYTAAEKAYATQFEYSKENRTPDAAAFVNKEYMGSDQYNDDQGKKFAKAFSENFSKDVSGPLSDAIYNFVKEISLTVIPKALVSPAGPVTGTILPLDFEIM